MSCVIFQAMESRYIVGIDLGTTNSAAGYIDLHDVSAGALEIKSFDILQLTGPGRLDRLKTLPSFLYLPGQFDLEQGATALPWDEERDYAVGAFARDQGARVPGRLVSSAKSWLCHGGVERRAAILPWGAGADVKKVSPVEASARYLRHIAEAWEHEMGCRLADQEVVVTVPASFDQAARELTLEAASMAGLGDITLLEEPLAAFYAWLSHHEDDWQEVIPPGQLLLVCDIGGGTSDFTLISCEADGQSPRLERLAVGDHLLLGGDNIDLSLAAIAEKKIGQKLDQSRWQLLFHQCRRAKEILLSEDGPDTASVRLPGSGRSLVGGTLVASLSKREVEAHILDGFFPELSLKEIERRPTGTSALREMGLPYESDPAITAHLGRFLLKQGHGRTPGAVLFNGGTMKPAILRERLRAILGGWHEQEVSALESRSLDLAISWGAVYYGLVRRGLGLRVGGGLPRSYFIGIGSRQGKEGGSRRAVCLIPRGTEEGRDIEIDRDFTVMTNTPVKFTLYSSTVRKGDSTGDVVDVNDQEFVRLPPLQTVLKFGKGSEVRPIPVHVGSKVTAIGTLELYCRAKETPHRWRLQFQLRGQEGQGQDDYQVEGVRIAAKAEEAKRQEAQRLTEEDLAALDRARAVIEACFGKDSKGTSGDGVKPGELVPRLQEALEMDRSIWSLALLRRLADVLLEVKEGRKRSQAHEMRWFNLTGFAMRPGTGEALDPWRMKKIWPLYFQGLVHVRKIEPRLQWWIFWRRVAAGLSTGQQGQLFSSLAPVLAPSLVSKRKRSKARQIKVAPEELKQMWLLAANLERLDVQTKAALGRRLLELLGSKSMRKEFLWALGRIGARQPLYGPVNRVVSPGEVRAWVEELKRREWKDKRAVIEAAVSLCRVTGDRARDLPQGVRDDVALWLELMGARPEQIEPIREYRPLEQGDRESAFGESLPEGLILEGLED